MTHHFPQTTKKIDFSLKFVKIILFTNFGGAMSYLIFVGKAKL